MDNSHRFSFVEEEYPFTAGLKCSNSSSLHVIVESEAEVGNVWRMSL